MMQQIDNVTVTDQAWAIFRREQNRRRPGGPKSIVLHYMPKFVNGDGSNVEGFAPGYTIDFVKHAPTGEAWLSASLPDGTPFHFMPKFAWRADESYVVDQASAYTLSIAAASGRQQTA